MSEVLESCEVHYRGHGASPQEETSSRSLSLQPLELKQGSWLQRPTAGQPFEQDTVPDQAGLWINFIPEENLQRCNGRSLIFLICHVRA